VLPWPDTSQAWPAPHTPGDVVVEAFGCHLPDAFVALMQRPCPPAWINLEYFSAETYVERSHGLPSPVMHGPGKGLRKHFFFPGVNARTGGLLMPMHPAPAATSQDDTANRQAVLSQLGVPWQAGERTVSIFCYARAPLHAWLDALHHASATTCHVLLTPGPAQVLGRSWHAPNSTQTHLQLHALQALPQTQFDQLLAVCDLNIVRGEDSAISALWTGRPHVWHIYRQEDGAHTPKLHAFMDHWMQAWPEPLRHDVQQIWQAFNGLTDMPQFTQLASLWAMPRWASWQENSLKSSQRQRQETDLVTRLLGFIASLPR
jgi:uncharacterized repeat protein (TIGR03837 family)